MKLREANVYAGLLAWLGNQLKGFMSGSSRRAVITKGAIAAVTARIIAMLFSLVSVPIVLQFLGSVRYGMWMIAVSTFSLMSFMDIGLTPVLQNKLAESYQSSDRVSFRHYCSIAVLISTIILLVGFVLVCSLQLLDWRTIFRIEDTRANDEVNGLVLVVSMYYVASFSLVTVESIYVATLRIDKTKVYDIGASFLGFGLLLLGILIEVDLPLLAMLNYAPGIALRTSLLWQLIRDDPAILRFEVKPALATIKFLLPSSVTFMGIQSLTVLIHSLPNLIIVRYLSLSEVTVFSVTHKLFSASVYMVHAILPVFWPIFTMAYLRGERGWIKSKLQAIVAVTLSALAGISLLLTVFGEQLLDVWTNGTVQVNQGLLLAFGAWLLMQGSVYWLSTVLHSISDFRFELFVFSLTAFLLALPAVLFQSAVGVEWVVWTMAASLFFGSVLPMILRLKRKLANPS